MTSTGWSTERPLHKWVSPSPSPSPGRSVGLSQQELADLLGVSKAYIVRLESGEANPSIAKAGRIFAALWLTPIDKPFPLLKGLWPLRAAARAQSPNLRLRPRHESEDHLARRRREVDSMRIDVHTHIWPDRIAPAVLQNMVGTFGYPAVGINTVDGIKEHMRASGVDKSVVLGVVERLEHLPGANDWLISIQDDMLVPFGAMHPDLEDKPAEVRRMREAGIKGFKLHPMVNSYYPDDPRMFPFYEEMGDDMVVEIHSGRWAHTQPGDTVWAEPARIMNVVRQFPKLKLIALHLGGFYMLDEAERELIGRENVLIDTTWPPALKVLGSETLAGIVSRHGAEKVCFGTDFPLADMAEDAKFIESLPLPDAAKEQMLGGNARELIGL